MDLTSDQPFWAIRNGLLSSYPTLRQDVRCDCAVVGGGITGALAAFHLIDAGVSVVLLDGRDIGTGSTCASTGLLQYEVDVPLRRLIHQAGRRQATRSYLLCLEAIRKLGALVGRLHIACGFEKRPSLQLAREPGEIQDLRDEFRLRRQIGIDLEFWREAEIQRHFPFTRPAGLFSEEAGQVDPHSLTHGLLRAGVRRGLRVFDRTQVVRIEPGRGRVQLRTLDHFTVTAQRVVIAAGYESGRFLSQRVGRLKSTFAVVSEPLERLPAWYRRCLIWETGLPYLYLRTLPDNRVMVGGEDEDFADPQKRDALLRRKSRTLVQKFRRLFPKTSLQVAYAWGGTFGETKDGLAYIGAHRSLPRAYFALGFGGNGINYSLIAAEIIRDHFLGRRNRDASIFAFDR